MGLLALIATMAMATTSIAPTISENKGKIPLTTQTTFYRSYKANSDDLKAYLSQLVAQYGGNYYQLYRVIDCESGWRPDVYSRGNISYGIAQFTPDTFAGYCSGDYKNPYDQLKCMVLMWNKNLQKRWDCFRYIYN